MNPRETPAPRPRANKGIAWGLVYPIALYLSVNFIGIFYLSVGPLNFAGYDIIFFLTLSIMLFKLTRGGTFSIPVDPGSALILLSLGLFLICLFLQMLRLDNIKSLSFVLLVARGYCFFFCILVVCRVLPDIRTINHWVFRIGTVISCVFLVAYIVFFISRRSIIFGLPFYEDGEFGSLRLEGFAQDPNFYGLLLCFALFTGISVSRSLPTGKRLFSWLALFVILINIALTVSRSLFIALVGSSLIIPLLSGTTMIARAKKFLITIVLMVSAIVFLFSVKLPFIGDSIATSYVSRSAAATPRTYYNTILYNYFWESPIIGHGLRSAELYLGGYGVFAHNSYLELMVEMGVVGLTLYMSFYFLILTLGINASRSERDIVPWVHMWVMFAFMMPFFGIYQSPALWLASGIIAARSSRLETVKQIHP